MKKQIRKSVICLTATVVMLSGVISATIPRVQIPTLTASAAEACVYTDPATGLKFTVNGQNAQICGCKGTLTELIFNKTVTANKTAYQVTSIASNAFKNNTRITKVTFKSGCKVKAIPSNCFSNCSGITSVTLPSTLTTIQTEAFRNCTKLKTLNIPANVTLLYHRAFEGCTSLTTVLLASGTKLTQLGQATFKGCTNLSKFTVSGNEFSQHPALQDDYYVYLPKTLSGPSYETFVNCPKIKIAYFHKESVDNWNNSFDLNVDVRYADGFEQNPININNAYNIKDQSYTDSAGNVFKWNFVDCNNADAGLTIKSITVNNSKVTIPSSIKYNKDNKTYSVVETASQLLMNDTTVTSIVFADTIKTINANCAAGATNLVSVTLPKNVESIGTQSFLNASKLSKIIYNGTALHTVDDRALSGTAWLLQFETKHPKADGAILGNFLVRYFGDKNSGNNSKELNVDCAKGIYTFNDATGKYEQKKVCFIGWNAFNQTLLNYNPTYLKTINLAGVKKIHPYAFSKCSNLVSVYGGNDLIWIGTSPFHANTETKLKQETSNQNYIMLGTTLYKWLGTGTTADLSNITLTHIKASSFDNTKVTTLKLPKDISNLTIQSQAFINSKITNITVGGTKFSYNNVKNNVGTVQTFFEKNYDGLEGCQATKNNFLLPLCKEILTSIGVRYYGSAQSDSVLSPAKKIAIAGEIYRYCQRSFHYIDIIGGSGEYALYSNRGTCGPQARAYAYLLNAAGVKATITGSSNHAWDMVQIGNHWFNVDVCWKRLGAENLCTYFLRSDDDFKTIDSSCHTKSNYVKVSYDPACIAYGYADPKGTAMPTCKISMGDINGDGKVNSTDVQKIWDAGHYSVSYDTTYGDIDGDGKVTTRDSEFLRIRLRKLGQM